jgi:hypothetical protein
MDHSAKVGETPPIPQDLLKKIPDLKREFGDLFLFPVGDVLFAYRPMTLGEFLEYREMAQKDDLLAEEVALRAVIYPENAALLLDDMDMGSVARLITEIAKSSTIETFEELKTQMAAARLWAQTAEAAMIAWVCAAFPRYTVDECYKLTQSKLVKLSAMAEKILGKELEFESAKKDRKHRAFGMAAPPAFASDRRASEAMLPTSPEPRPEAGQPAFDFAAENKAIGF